MRYVSYIVAIATLAGAVAGCADPYYPRSGYSQGYNYPSGYSYYPPPNYSYSQPSYAYSQPSYAYSQPSYAYRSSAWDRNYNGIHPGPERTFP
jgi:hypothetical protein